jgi:hypothetical protein
MTVLLWLVPTTLLRDRVPARVRPVSILALQVDDAQVEFGI